MANFEAWLNALWERINRESLALKDSQRALEELSNLYRGLSARDQGLASDVISDWLLSDNPTKRFDALAMVNEFELLRAIPKLRELAAQLASRDKPADAYELLKVKRILERLARSESEPHE